LFCPFAPGANSSPAICYSAPSITAPSLPCSPVGCKSPIPQWHQQPSHHCHRHHTVYMILLSIIIIPRGFSPLFCLACILEFPTFLLAIGSLDARFRNDYVRFFFSSQQTHISDWMCQLFATVFFLTRIVFHIHLAFSLGLKAHADTLSWIPCVTLIAVFPMHVLWMRDCITGILRRRARAAKLISSGLSTAQMPITPLHAPVGSGFLDPTNVTPAVVTGIELQQEHKFRRETLERFRARVINLRPQEVYMRLQDPHMRAHVATEGMAAVKKLRDRLRQRLRVRIP
jgi:hypothetical protein